MLNAVGIRVEREYFASLAQQVYQISPVPTSGIEHTHILRDVPAQDLVENVNINLPKLLLNIQRNSIAGLASRFAPNAAGAQGT
jgi:hypothetical protein